MEGEGGRGKSRLVRLLSHALERLCGKDSEEVSDENIITLNLLRAHFLLTRKSFCFRKSTV